MTDAAERAVLDLLLAHHPAQLALEEVVRALAVTAPATDVDDALHALAGAGLVHMHGRFAFATRAAVRFEELAG